MTSVFRTPRAAATSLPRRRGVLDPVPLRLVPSSPVWPSPVWPSPVWPSPGPRRRGPAAVAGLLAICVLFVLGAHPANATEASGERVEFGRDVYPILKRACFECHGENLQEAGLRLDQRGATLESGMVEPGSPEDSELLRRVMLPEGDALRMPAVGEPLSSQQIATLRQWIDQGANWPEDFQPGRHWSYVPPERPELPTVAASDWPQAPIDDFVLRQLEDRGLEPAPPAAPEKLLRRVHLDLIGLPPTPEEINAFVRDPSPQHFQAIVDELLSRPQFGERWAMPWLDLARYADSHGFQRDNFRDIWAYRDWVIRAISADMPFDQFTIEQIAGDLLPNASESQRIATGFHRCTPTNVEAGSLPEETRIEQVIDRVNTTGAVWLGSTLECCQCHDHKYDPFTAEDYYQLLAYFNNTVKEADRTNPDKPSSIQFRGPRMALSDADRDTQRKRLKRRLGEVKQQQTQRRQELAGELPAWTEQIAARIANAPKNHPLRVVDFRSEGGTDTHRVLDDGSVLLVGGDPPPEDEYAVRLASDEPLTITAIRLDALTHPSLPGSGPGRGDPVRRNFVLNEFTAEVVTPAASADAEPSRAKLEFRHAEADFSQKNWPIRNAIDGKSKSGWAIAPQFGKPHWARFILQEPITLPPSGELTVKLTQRFGSARTIGRVKVSAVTGAVDQPPIPAAVIAAVKTKPAQWTPKQRKTLVDYRVKHDATFAALEDEAGRIGKQIDELAPETTLVMIEREKPRMTHVFNRGDYRNPGERVQPGTPDVLHPAPDGPPNRLTLARWLVSTDNPLVARVTVNRWWAQLFGQGIVTTVEDFGIKGEPPSHPQLLDWLAVEFMANGWSRKRLLKSIVTSATYQQSSRVRHDLRDIDPENRLLARGPRFRMDAETIRDNALAISGLLSLKQFGPPIRPYQPEGIWSKVGGTAYKYEVSPDGERHRRGIYVVLKRGSPYPSFMNFDATPRLACTVKRSRTNTPLQALTLLNDPVYVEAARALAKRMERERAQASLDEKIAYGFLLCTGREPNQSELATLSHLYRSQADADQPLVGVATVLLNLHETITKD